MRTVLNADWVIFVWKSYFRQWYSMAVSVLTLTHPKELPCQWWICIRHLKSQKMEWKCTNDIIDSNPYRKQSVIARPLCYCGFRGQDRFELSNLVDDRPIFRNWSSSAERWLGCNSQYGRFKWCNELSINCCTSRGMVENLHLGWALITQIVERG